MAGGPGWEEFWRGEIVGAGELSRIATLCRCFIHVRLDVRADALTTLRVHAREHGEAEFRPGRSLAIEPGPAQTFPLDDLLTRHDAATFEMRLEVLSPARVWAGVSFIDA